MRTGFDTFAKPPEFELYDLENDPWEFNNLLARPSSQSDEGPGNVEYAQILERLKTALQAWRQETDDPTLDPTFNDRITKEIADRFQGPKQ